MTIASIMAMVIAAASLMCTPVEGVQLYTIISRSDQGDLKITARKSYNIWDDGPNRTYYDVELFSPSIKFASQEIRVALQWQWPSSRWAGYESERVIFYAPVRSGRFNQYRVDGNIQFDGSLLFDNY